MRMPKGWPCSILAAILWLAHVQAAPASAPAPQRSFASAEEAASAFVTAFWYTSPSGPAMNVMMPLDLNTAGQAINAKPPVMRPDSM